MIGRDWRSGWSCKEQSNNLKPNDFVKQQTPYENQNPVFLGLLQGFFLTFSSPTLISTIDLSLDLTAVTSPNHQLAWPISTIDQPRLIQRLSCNLTQTLAQLLSSWEHARKVVFSCYVSLGRANRVKSQDIAYGFEGMWNTTYHLRKPATISAHFFCPRSNLRCPSVD